LNKSDLINVVAREAGLPKAAAERVVNTFLAKIADGLSRGERVTLSGFGTFEVRKMKATTKKVPLTGQRVQVPEHLRSAFIAGEGLKKAVRG